MQFVGLIRDPPSPASQMSCYPSCMACCTHFRSYASDATYESYLDVEGGDRVVICSGSLADTGQHSAKATADRSETDLADLYIKDDSAHVRKSRPVSFRISS